MMHTGWHDHTHTSYIQLQPLPRAILSLLTLNMKYTQLIPNSSI